MHLPLLLELELLHLLQVHMLQHLLLLLLHEHLPVLHGKLLEHRHGVRARRVVRQRVDRCCTDW